MSIRKANAEWDGNFRSGGGHMHPASGVGDEHYTTSTRFEDAPGTNPEELLGAAHAGCFSQALALALDQAGYPPQHIETDAQVHLDKLDGGFSITAIDLETRARVPNIPESVFLSEAEKAKQTCPVSQALKAVPITLQAHLVSQG